MIDPTLWSNVPFRAPTAFRDWGGTHALVHQAIADTAARASKPYQVYPLGGGVGTKGWMQAHAQEHINANLALAVSGPANLSDYNLGEREDWDNFHLVHADEHRRLHTAAGIV